MVLAMRLFALGDVTVDTENIEVPSIESLVIFSSTGSVHFNIFFKFIAYL